jgi:hypothetical protein
MSDKYVLIGAGNIEVSRFGDKHAQWICLAKATVRWWFVVSMAINFRDA